MGRHIRVSSRVFQRSAVRIPQEALVRYNAKTGDHRWQSLWELLCIAVALRTWAHLFTERGLTLAPRHAGLCHLYVHACEVRK